MRFIKILRLMWQFNFIIIAGVLFIRGWIKAGFIFIFIIMSISFIADLVGFILKIKKGD